MCRRSQPRGGSYLGCCLGGTGRYRGSGGDLVKGQKLEPQEDSIFHCGNFTCRSHQTVEIAEPVRQLYGPHGDFVRAASRAEASSEGQRHCLEVAGLIEGTRREQRQ